MPSTFGALGVHRKNRAAERAAQQVPQHGAAHAAGTLGGADDGNAFGQKQRVERMSFGAVDVGRWISFQVAWKVAGLVAESVVMSPRR